MAEIFNLTSILGIISIVLQIAAAYFACKLIRITGTFRAWILIILALILMTLRRITAQLITWGYLQQLTGSIGIIDRLVLPLLISIFLVLGMYDLLKLFKEQKSKNEKQKT